MITVKEMKKLEASAIKRDISVSQLMENAGQQVFEIIKERCDLFKQKIIIFAGYGNNGGDGFVTARYFYENGNDVLILFFGDENRMSEAAKENYHKIKEKVNVLQINSKDDLNLFKLQKDLDLILVDALLGTGVQGEVREPISFAIDYFNEQQGFKVSIDVPSGLDADTGEGKKYCDFDLIICLHDLKIGLEKFKEKVVVADIGLGD